MNTLQEKISFAVAGLLYLLFHLRGGGTAAEMIAGTAVQLLTTAPYCIGCTYLLVRLICWLHHGKQIAWDRTVRIFFSFGILFGLFFGLYEYLDQARQLQEAGAPVSAQH